MATRKKSPAKAARQTRATKATKTTKATKANGGKAAASGVTVRMFCQGLGDCFLISIPQAAARPYSILIDLGVAKGTARASELMTEVVDEIVRLTGGSASKRGTVDLLVVTHQHWDHVSGFLQVPAALRRLDIKHLWMAWTENEKDGLANALREEFGKAKLALDRALARAAALGAGDPSSAARLAGLRGIMSFFGAPLGAAGDADEVKGGMAEAMTAARRLVGNAEDAVECLLPGHAGKLPGARSGLAKGIEAIVLGPPHDRAKLVRINPRESRGEAYEKRKGDAPGLAVNAGWNVSVMKQLLGADADAAGTDSATEVFDPEFDRAQPFDRQRSRRWRDVEKAPPPHATAEIAFFRQHYFDETGINQERRIDGDWLWSGAQRLALQMDSYTNNTSLVLALELPRSKDVLLFVGDAQIGSWLSWHDQVYTTSDGRELTAAQLLGRTVLYKVGHHGSHNATLREQGFELMTHPDLVAMLPVEAEGVSRLGYGQMPLRSLVEVLHDRTRGRVLRVDQPWPGGKAPEAWKGQRARAAQSKRTLAVGKEEVTERPCYLEVVIPDR